jgi:hypothetical protein
MVFNLSERHARELPDRWRADFAAVRGTRIARVPRMLVEPRQVRSVQVSPVYAGQLVQTPPSFTSGFKAELRQRIDRATINAQRGARGGGCLWRGHVHDHIGHFFDANSAPDDGTRTVCGDKLPGHGLDRLAGFRGLGFEELSRAFR